MLPLAATVTRPWMTPSGITLPSTKITPLKLAFHGPAEREQDKSVVRAAAIAGTARESGLDSRRGLDPLFRHPDGARCNVGDTQLAPAFG